MSEWISVEERLPDKSGTYLVVKRGERFSTTLYWGGIAEDIVFWLDYITHWQPLPSPPGEEGE